MQPALEPVSARDALVARSGLDVFVDTSLAPGEPVAGYALGPAVAWVRTSAHWRLEFLTVVGPAPEAAALAVAADAALPRPVYGLTAPRAAWPLLPAALRPEAWDEWDFWWIGAPPPPQPGEAGCAWLDAEADAAELAELLERASPRRSADVGDPHVVRWCGIREPAGRLVACAAEVDGRAHAPQLASVAVAPEGRSQGLGRAVTAWLTRALLAEGHPVVTLGMYSDNEPARRAYRAIGYRDSHQWCSGRTPAGDVAAAARGR